MFNDPCLDSSEIYGCAPGPISAYFTWSSWGVSSVLFFLIGVGCADLSIDTGEVALGVDTHDSSVKESCEVSVVEYVGDGILRPQLL